MSESTRWGPSDQCFRRRAKRGVRNERGPWILAPAANRFRGDALPENAVPMRRLIHRQKTEGGPGTPYVRFKTAPDSPGRIGRDADGVP